MVDSVFKVWDKSTAGCSEYVVLFLDSSYFCTCAMLQNKGIVCRHFFWMVQEDGRFKYHIRFVLRRWFQEAMQQCEITENKIKALPFITAVSCRDPLSAEEGRTASGKDRTASGNDCTASGKDRTSDGENQLIDGDMDTSQNSFLRNLYSAQNRRRSLERSALARSWRCPSKLPRV